MTAQPFTSYSVARVQQDFKKGNTIIGALLTSTNRVINEEHLKGLVKNAYAGAVDFEQYFFKRNYFIRGILQYSDVGGDKVAITNLQRSPVHFYQREGVTHLGVDSSRTNLTGNAGRIIVGRRGTNNKIISEQRLAWAPPGFDFNNLGFVRKADYKYINGFLGYSETKPQGIFRRYFFDVFYMYETDFSNKPLSGRIGSEAELAFKNNYFAFISAFYDAKQIETSLLRGGPPVDVNPRWGTDLMIESDGSKRVSAGIYHGTMLGDIRYAQFGNVTVNYRPMPNLNLSARVNYTYSNKQLEYVGKHELENNGRQIYLMGALKQEIIGLTTRIDYIITPELSIQFYGNPFISTGKYSKFKRATDTMDKTFENRFHLLQPDELAYNAQDNNYSAREASTGYNYSFDNPDFSFREFRFNLVARWEYKPNSIIYLVWAQDRSGRASEYIPSFSQNTRALFDYYPGNVFMVKLNYWFAL
ncbi:MAG: DUF5916 domain-containing protein [Tannerella sp.]|jgi:hypothetical protein|nr:DUF5916 domain-containing protein [Tannerella sp.]